MSSARGQNTVVLHPLQLYFFSQVFLKHLQLSYSTRVAISKEVVAATGSQSPLEEALISEKSNTQMLLDKSHTFCRRD